MKYRFTFGGEAFTLDLVKNGDGYLARIDGEAYDVAVRDLGEGELEIRIDGRHVRAHTAAHGDRRWVALDAGIFELRLAAGRRRAGEAAGEGLVRAPMPGQVRAVRVAVGETVRRGQPLLLLEAMKMEIRIQSPIDGAVAALPVRVGDQVDVDQLLAEIR